MSASVHRTLELPRRGRTGTVVAVFLIVSVLGHVGAFALVEHLVEKRAAAPIERPIEMVMVEVEPPPPAPPPPEEPKPPIKVASVKKAPPPPVEKLPPPPNEPPPETEAKPQPAPVVVGVTMSSTTSAGGFAAPVGNTTYGKVDSTARAPSEVKPYSAPKYSPIYQVDREPSVALEVKAPYTPEARRAGIEGSVIVSVMIDNLGNVVAAKVKKGLGYGLDEAAVAALRKFRFKPATKNGEAVSTEIPYAYTFYLD